MHENRRSTRPFPILAERVYATTAQGSAILQRTVDALSDLVRFERTVTVTCTMVPLMLIAAGGWPPRPSISAYYSIGQAQVFYMPLSAAGMLFMVNGVVRQHTHWYNVWLGVSLGGLTWFNHERYTLIHFACAAAFFLGNAVVFVVFRSTMSVAARCLLAGGMLAVLLGHFVLHWYTLFWAESFSLWLIALHCYLDLRPTLRYGVQSRHLPPAV